MSMLTFELLRKDAVSEWVQISFPHLIIAGWTGRDAQAIEHHIEELRLLGVGRPSAVPLYYRCSPTLLSQAPQIQVLGSYTSGEVEPFLFLYQDQWWLSVASDHTDRDLECHGVAWSKQVCAKPVAQQAWLWSDVAAHADQIVLRSYIVEQNKPAAIEFLTPSGNKVLPYNLYQEGSLKQIRPLPSLIEGAASHVSAHMGVLSFGLLCGTVPVIANAAGQGIRAASAMKMVLHDPVLQRNIEASYKIVDLAVVA